MIAGTRTGYSRQLANDEIICVLEDIPSDPESYIGDVDEEDDQDEAILLQNEGDLAAVPSDGLHSDESDWESEDEIPLARQRECFTVWTQDNVFCETHIKEFAEETGPTIPDDLETPTDIFLHIYPQDLIDMIVFQTNLYAIQKAGGSLASHTPTNSQEIKVFLAINLMMGIKKLPSYRDYWSTNPELRDQYLSSLMSRNRFMWLLGNIHLNDNTQQPLRGSTNFDKLHKILPMIEILSRTYLSSYKPSKNQSVDESMIKFKGRSSLRQYMPMKPIKRGYKVWVHANESGYISEFQIYTGRISDAAEKNLGARVVKDLTRSLVGRGHHVYFDNYFNSVQLQKDLKKQFIYACGTVRANRKDLPSDLVDEKKMVRGESDWRVSKDGLAFLKWKDTKAVNVLGNFLDPSNNSTTSRKQKDGTSSIITCPEMIVKYNKNMGFVDKADMLKSLYEIDRKSKKWWHRTMWYFLDVSVVNAFIIFKARSIENDKSLSLKEFRIAVVSGLVGVNINDTRTRRGRTSTPEQAKFNRFKPNVSYEKRYDQRAHLPTYSTSRRCAYCSTKSEPHRSKWCCSVCQVALCLSAEKNCFAKYHTK